LERECYNKRLAISFSFKDTVFIYYTQKSITLIMKRNSINYLAEAKVDNYTSWGTVVTGVGYHFIEPNSFYPIKGHPKD
jgi:hypothetical protein